METQVGNGLIKVRKIRSIVLYHETSIWIPWISYEIMIVNLAYETYHEQVHSINVDHDSQC